MKSGFWAMHGQIIGFDSLSDRWCSNSAPCELSDDRGVYRASKWPRFLASNISLLNIAFSINLRVFC